MFGCKLKWCKIFWHDAYLKIGKFFCLSSERKSIKKIHPTQFHNFTHKNHGMSTLNSTHGPYYYYYWTHFEIHFRILHHVHFVVLDGNQVHSAYSMRHFCLCRIDTILMLAESFGKNIAVVLYKNKYATWKYCYLFIVPANPIVGRVGQSKHYTHENNDWN